MLLLTSELQVRLLVLLKWKLDTKETLFAAEVPSPGCSMPTPPATRQVGLRSPKMAFYFQKSLSSLNDLNEVHRTLPNLLQDN